MSMSGWSIAMLSSGGLFSVGVSFFAWGRIPAWRAMSSAAFHPDFARWIRRADRLQPALLVVCVISTIGFALAASGTTRAFAVIATAGFLLTLIGSGAILVPLQRRLIKGADGEVETMRRRWYRGHLVRTTITLASFALVTVAAL